MVCIEDLDFNGNYQNRSKNLSDARAISRALRGEIPALTNLLALGVYFPIQLFSWQCTDSLFTEKAA